MSISRHQINFSFRNSFCSFTSKKKNNQILISQCVYARNFYCFNCFFPFHFYFFYAFTFPLSFIFILINLSVYSYIYLIDFHFILKKLKQFSRKDKNFWLGTYCKIKNTKLLIQVYSQIKPIHLALTVKLQLPFRCHNVQ